MMKRELYTVEGDKVSRQRRFCPRCGPGIFLAEHENRYSCGKCGYTEFKKQQKEEKAEPEKAPKDKKAPKEQKA